MVPSLRRTHRALGEQCCSRGVAVALPQGFVEIEIKSIPPQMPHSRGERDTAAIAIDDPDVTYRASTTQQGHSTYGKVLQENGAAYNYCLL
jgi:hypothetical protein